MDTPPQQPTIETPPEWPVEFRVPEEFVKKRVDLFLAAMLPQHSRAAIQRALAAGQILLEGKKPKASGRLEAGWLIVVTGIETVRPGPEPQEIPLDILYEDDWLVVVNKKAGMIVHPAKGHWNGTLASALAFRFGQLSTVGGPTRPGIVHRLDRDTSGVIVVAKNDQTHQRLADQFKDRTIEKQYLAIVRGQPDRDADIIDRPIGQHPRIREQMAVRPQDPSAKPALTQIEVVERFKRFALLRAFPKTGRTHQIRVHLASIGLPVLCDKLYGGSAQASASDLAEKAPGESGIGPILLARQALHAERLTFTHPQTGERMTVEAPLAEDISTAISCLRG